MSSNSNRSLAPHLLGSNYWDLWDYPQDIYGQDFGVPSSTVTESGGFTIGQDPQNFEVNLDVHHFKPEEITVKHVGDTIVVHGKHQEKSDPHGFVSRQFTRKYTLPAEVDFNQVACKYDNNTLTILGPHKAQEAIDHNERIIPIDYADRQPSLAQASQPQSRRRLNY
ncbi:Alpha-crystallin A chain [Halotydeus destructor]|nr:Alpha-crystallin A chain [Halotydeus destructor]